MNPSNLSLCYGPVTCFISSCQDYSLPVLWGPLGGSQDKFTATTLNLKSQVCTLNACGKTEDHSEGGRGQVNLRHTDFMFHPLQPSGERREGRHQNPGKTQHFGCHDLGIQKLRCRPEKFLLQKMKYIYLAKVTCKECWRNQLVFPQTEPISQLGEMLDSCLLERRTPAQAHRHRRSSVR